MPFAAAISEHPVTATAIGEVAGQVLERLGAGTDLALLFVTPHHAGALEDAAGAVRTILEPTCLLGGAAEAVLGAGREVETGPGVTLWAGRMGRVHPLRLRAQTPGAAPEGWPDRLPFHPSLLVLLGDPFSFAAAPMFDWLAGRHPGLPVIGGNVSAGRGPGGNRLAVDGVVVSDGAVGALVQPATPVTTVVSQGCRPVGQPFVVTRAERNVVYELGGRPAYERLLEMARNELSDDERAQLSGGVLLGVVVDEYRVEYRRDDFVVRAVLGADKENGAVAVEAEVEVGRTVQYHVRDAGTADEDLRMLLRGRQADGALLFTCHGRGRRLFAEPHHDAAVIDDLLDRPATGGFFTAGEFGPVAGRNFTHGSSAAMALLVDDEGPAAGPEERR